MPSHNSGKKKEQSSMDDLLNARTIERPLSAMSRLSNKTVVPTQTREQLADALARLSLDINKSPNPTARALPTTRQTETSKSTPLRNPLALVETTFEGSQAAADSGSSAHFWSLTSSEINSTYADSYTAELISNPEKFYASSLQGKIRFYQSFVLQWDLATVECLPQSIKGCKDLLRLVNVNIAELLKAIKNGQSLRSVRLYRSKTHLRLALLKGKRADLKTVKAEMLQPFLVTLYF